MKDRLRSGLEWSFRSALPPRVSTTARHAQATPRTTVSSGGAAPKVVPAPASSQMQRYDPNRADALGMDAQANAPVVARQRSQGTKTQASPA
jgi:hypothetical protein